MSALAFIGYIFLACLVITFFPLILAFIAAVICLIVGGLFWVKEQLFPGNPTK